MAGFVAFGVLRVGHAVWTPILVMAVALIANSVYNDGLWVRARPTGLALGSSLAALTAVGCASFPIGRWGGWRSAAGRRAVRRFELSPMTQLSVQLGGRALWRGLFLNAVLVGSSVYAERFSTPELAAHGLALQIWLLLAFVIDGFAHAGTAFGSQLIGSGEHRQARTLGWRLMRHSVILCVVLRAQRSLEWIARLIGLDGVAQMAFAALLLPMMRRRSCQRGFRRRRTAKGRRRPGVSRCADGGCERLVFPTLWSRSVTAGVSGGRSAPGSRRVPCCAPGDSAGTDGSPSPWGRCARNLRKKEQHPGIARVLHPPQGALD